MLLERGQRYADVEARTVRDVLRNLHHPFERPDELTEATWQQLLQEGRVVADEEYRRSGAFFKLTPSGFALVNARIGKPIDRKKATQLVQDVIPRIAEVNSDSLFPLRVTRLLVFGSYARGERTVGDVDLVLEYERKEGANALINRMALNEMLDLDNKLVRRLKRRSPYLSFHYDHGVPPDGRAELRRIWPPPSEILDTP